MKTQVRWLFSGMVLLGVLVLLAACNLPGSDTGGLLGSAGEERAVPATPFLQGETVDYGDEVLILREVNAGEGSAIESVVLWVPVKVSVLAVTVNGSAVTPVKNDEDLRIDVPTPAAEVLLEFKDESGALVKSCRIQIDTILSPEGDCAW
ncbi:MAG: hypothetical protein HPY85_16080 [Anaerolineae bacterium]|nr:hypothetical protein [Anaerolineae bacterium]